MKRTQRKEILFGAEVEGDLYRALKLKVWSQISGDDTVGEYFGPLYEPGTSPPKRKYRKQFEKIERMPEVRYW